MFFLVISKNSISPSKFPNDLCLVIYTKLLFIQPHLYTNLSISAKSPLWKVYPCHISLHYTVFLYFLETPRPPTIALPCLRPTPTSGGRNTPNPPGLTPG